MSLSNSRTYFGTPRARGQEKILLLGAALLAFMAIGVGVTLIAVETLKPPLPAPAAVQLGEVQVLIPKRDIAAGSPLLPSDFEFARLPENQVPIDSLKSLEEINRMFSRTLLIKGQPLTAKYIDSAPILNSIIEKIPAGYRAVAIRVDAEKSVEGWTVPGAHVDVLWDTVLRGRPAVLTVVENAKVLSSERSAAVRSGENSIIPSTVTLLVLSDDAEKIHYASRSGSLTLSLRGDLPDPARASNGPTTIDSIIHQDPEQSKDNLITGEITIAGAKYGVTASGRLIPK